MSTKLGKLLGSLLLSGALAITFTMGGCSSDVSPPPTGAAGSDGGSGDGAAGSDGGTDKAPTDTAAPIDTAVPTDTGTDAPAAETGGDASDAASEVGG